MKERKGLFLNEKLHCSFISLMLVCSAASAASISFFLVVLAIWHPRDGQQNKPPYRRPNNCRDAFNNKHSSPAKGINKIARKNGHPQHGNRVAKEKESISFERSFFVNQWLKKNSIAGITTFCHAKKEANHRKDFTSCTIPVAVAGIPHRIRLQNISF